MDVAMMKARRRSRPTSAHRTYLERPSIKVEKSFMISFDYGPVEFDHQTSRSMTPHNGDQLRIANHRGSTYKAEASAARPANTRNPPSTASNSSEQMGLDPAIAVSEDIIDLHEALRTQLPPFKQSKRWARAYVVDNQSFKPTATPSSAPQNQQETRIHDQQPSDSIRTPVDGISDTEAEHHGLCRPAHVPGWQAFKKHRLRRQQSMPTRTVNAPTSNNPKRIKSANSIGARLHTNPRWFMVPTTVQGGNANHEGETRLPTTSKRLKKCRLQDSSHRSAVGACSNAANNKFRDRSASPVSSLHNYGKVRQFSTECTTMLSRFDFEDSSQSVPAPALYIPQITSTMDTGTNPSQSFSQLPQAPSGQVPAVTCHNVGSGQRLPTSSSENGCGSAIPHNTNTPQEPPKASRGALLNEARGLSGSPTNDADDEADVGQSYGASVLAKKVSKSSCRNQQLAQKSFGGPEAARSMDTLTKIEAQVEISTTSPNRRLESHGSSFTRTSSPKRLRPAGEPPERPLPDLPKDDASDSRSTLYRRPSFASSCKSRLARDTFEVAQPFAMASVQTMIHVPPLPKSMTNRASIKPRISTYQPIYHYQPRSARGGRSINATVRKVSPVIPQEARSSTTVEVKGAKNDRNSRIQQMKKRHIDAWSKAREANTESKSPGFTVSEVQHVHSGMEPQIQESSQPSGVAKTSHLLNQDSSAVTNATRMVSVKNLREKFAVPSPSLTVDDLTKSNLDTKGLPGAASTSQTVGAPSDKSQRRPSTSNSSQKALSRSQIMVLVDSNPHTASFSAGVLSPQPSILLSTTRPADPPDSRVSGQTSTVLPVHRSTSAPPSSANHGGIRPPIVIPKRRGSRGVQPQSSARHLGDNVSKHSSELTPHTTRSLHSNSRARRHPILESSGSEPEGLTLHPLDTTLSPPLPQPPPQVSPQSSHVRRVTPFTAVLLKEEMRKSELELDTLNRSEQKVGNLSTHLGQTLQVWGRMSQSGKKQYLTYTCGVDVESGPRGRGQVKERDVTKNVASSVYSTRSSLRRLDNAVGKSGKQTLDISNTTTHELRRTSAGSTATRTGTDTDTDASAGTFLSAQEKRESEGSLTDLQDYDLPPLPPPPPSRSLNTSTSVEVPKGTKSESLGTNLNDLRARLQANRPSNISARRCKPRTAIELTPPTTANSRTTSRPSSNRRTATPWEDMIEYGKQQKENDDDGAIDRLTLEQETMGTDQMDAMLVF